MRKFYLENIYFEKRTDNSLKAYKKTKNPIVVTFIKRIKKILSSLNLCFVKCSNPFWKTVKSFFSKKGNLIPNKNLVKKKTSSNTMRKNC